MKQELSPTALAWLRAQTVDCQSCGDVVPAEQWAQHSHEHLMGKRPVLSINECMARNEKARKGAQ